MVLSLDIGAISRFAHRCISSLEAQVARNVRRSHETLSASRHPSSPLVRSPKPFHWDVVQLVHQNSVIVPVLFSHR